MKKIVWTLAGVAVSSVTLLAVSLGTRTGQDFLLERLVQRGMSRTQGAPFDGLRVFMCGTSSPLPAPGRAQACVMISAGGNRYIIDAGAGSPATLGLAGVPLDNLRAVLLTHFHSDHIAALGDLNLASWVAGRSEPLVVMGPEGVERVVAGFNEAYDLDSGYRVAHHGPELLPPELSAMRARTIGPGLALERDGLVVTAFVVDHSPIRPALGYRFEYEGRSVVVSGDTVVTPELKRAARGADLLLQDAISLPIVQTLERGARATGQDRLASIFHDIQDYHAPAASLSALAETAGVKQLAVYHLVPPPRNFLFARVFARDLPDDVVLTEDGMVFDLPAGGEEIILR